MENQSARQLQRLEKDLPQELRPYERQRASDERLLLFAPPVVRTQPPEKPRPLPGGIQEVVTPVAPAY